MSEQKSTGVLKNREKHFFKSFLNQGTGGSGNYVGGRAFFFLSRPFKCKLWKKGLNSVRADILKCNWLFGELFIFFFDCGGQFYLWRYSKRKTSFEKNIILCMGIYFFIRKLDRKEGGQEKQGEKAS